MAGTQSNGPYPPAFQDLVNDPNALLRNAIAGQNILGTITIQLSTTGVGSGIENIPFLGLANSAQATNPTTANAFVSQASVTFWIEWVAIPGAPSLGVAPSADVSKIEPFWPTRTFLQLQYSQISILIFNGVLWPHVNVATLRLSNG